jgi:NitT/TauT family transport system permease protein
LATEAALLSSELDALGSPAGNRRLRPTAAAAWRTAWPRLAAIGAAVGAWQVVVWLGFRPDYLLPGPGPVLERLFDSGRDPEFYGGVAITLERAIRGYALALVAGGLLGALVTRSRTLRLAVGSLISGLQSMPSIAWFPMAILLFGLSDAAITFVVILGAAPSIANGLITGIDQVAPLLIRAGHSIGARRLTLFRYVLLPASLPSFIGGLKQGWAFAWRSLMAGELLVILGGRPSLGVRLILAREMSDAAGLLAIMIVVLLIGIVADLGFGVVDRAVRRRWGLIQ